LVYADDVNILGDDIGTIKKNTQTLINTSKVIGLEVNTEKTKYMSLSGHQNTGQNHDIKIGNRCFEKVAQFKYLGWVGHVARMGEKRIAYRILVGKPEGKRALGRPRPRWVDNIKMDLREIGEDGVDCIDLAQDRTSGGLL
jgi:hypothetical protein